MQWAVTSIRFVKPIPFLVLKKATPYLHVKQQIYSFVYTQVYTIIVEYGFGCYLG